LAFEQEAEVDIRHRSFKLHQQLRALNPPQKFVANTFHEAAAMALQDFAADYSRSYDKFVGRMKKVTRFPTI
jgi:hypothetical protein